MDLWVHAILGFCIQEVCYGLVLGRVLGLHIAVELELRATYNSLKPHDILGQNQSILTFGGLTGLIVGSSARLLGS